ncbi:MAG TPA: glycoside hydrolase family 172 protein [Solirubrobacteraceae bacterium]
MSVIQHTLISGLAHLSNAQSRSVSPENFTGEKGKGGMATLSDRLPQLEKMYRSAGVELNLDTVAAQDLGQAWKVSPNVMADPGETITLADIEGPGAITQIWLTPTGNWRFAILRIYWDDQEEPSVECPLGDFFAMGWGEYAPLSSLAVCVNPGSAFNCYWEMPFHKRACITLSNIADEAMIVYYQINYEARDVPDDALYLHVQFRRANPLPYADVYTILDGVSGAGNYVGTYVAWGSNSNGWWGEGEVKFYLDGDEWPTICGTGTEDYFCGSYNFENQVTKQYEEFSTPYAGLHQVIRPDGLYRSQLRFGMYRWHITDPIRFQQDLRVTMQALGNHNNRLVHLQDDVASVAYWYQTLPTTPFPLLPERDQLEVI